MAIVALGLWMLLEFSSILTAESLHWSKVCEGNQLKYLSFSDQILFYINGNTVDRMSFCKSLNRYRARDCVPSSSFQEWEEVGMRYCGLEVSLEELPQRSSRKILDESGREYVSHGLSQQSHETEENHDRSTLLSPKIMAMAVPGMFLLSCFLFCPCFQSKRKETDHAVLTKNPNSTDSVSSVEISSSTEKVPCRSSSTEKAPNRSSSTEKVPRRSSSTEKAPNRSSSTENVPNSPGRVPASPFRMPGSPKRVPPNPMRVPPSPSRFSMSPKLTKIGSVHLSLTQVMKATHNFSPSLQVGEGGFGTVYRAELQDGQVVAMKRAKKELFDTLRGEFSSEIELLTKIEHRNLVKLLGYVDKGNERIIITEYVPNGTLRDHLDGQRGRILDFNQRLEISIDIAHALTYLHLYTEKQIIHRDVKSSNILLTESCRAKVADFGFARLGPTEGEQTYVVTKVKGTVGYLDPEYLKTYQLTPKSDVYSFGILLVEILTGRRPVELRRELEERVTVRWAFTKYNEGNIFEILDPLLNEVIDADILSKMFGLAFQCAAPTRLDRPNMKEVGEQLWAIRMDYSRSVRKAG